jgi:hypothetical protein
VFPLPLSLAHAATIDTFYSNNDYEYSCISKIFSPHVIFCIRYQKRKEKKRKEKGTRKLITALLEVLCRLTANCSFL